jgi:GNAT superfamily N-acetyltransferase
MSGSDSHHILLIHPPVASPTMYPWVLAYTVSCITSWGTSLHYYDANLDFFLYHILTSKTLTGFLELVKKREKQGVFKGYPISMSKLAKDISINHELWNRKISTIGFNLESLRTGEFYKPEKYISAITDINDLLMLVSLAFYPSCIHWSGFSNPDVKELRHIDTFVDDRDTNPFLGLCENGLTSRIACKALKLLVILVASPGQALAALTLARHSKKLRPDLDTVIMGNHELFGASGYVGNFLQEKDLKRLVKRTIPSRGGGTEECISIPDFSGLPLRGYLSPDIVLPIKLSGDLMSQWHTILGLAQGYKRKFASTVFVNIENQLPMVFIKKLAEDPTTDKPSVLLGTTCTPDGSADSTNMDAVYRAGVRLIHWQASSGENKALAGVLWNASNAGIWNNVIIPENVSDEELIHYVADNPAVAHSWTQSWSSKSNHLYPDDRVKPLGPSYANVSELPGKPFWHWLSDPVYMLLYVKKYGVKKLVQWRVSEDRKIYTLGSSMEYHFVKPQELPHGYLEKICKMVEAGGSVGTTWVRHNLKNAFLIGYVTERGSLVANSSLKQPRPEYIDAVSNQSGINLRNYLERGYTSVRPEYRGMGIGTKLLEGLTKRIGDRKLFSIIAEDNIATKKMALRNRTKKVAQFYSDRVGKEIGIWVPEWMIDDISGQ